MKRSITFRKKMIWGIPILVLLAVTGGVYYLATYRLKSSVRYAVHKASEGRYVFDAETVRLSLLDKSFVLKQARLDCVDTTNVNAHYNVRVKEIYFSVSSIWALLLNRKVMVDSLLVIEPDIQVYVHSENRPEKKKTAFHTSNFINYLQAVLKKFNARSLVIKDAAFTYGLLSNPRPFYANHINVSFENFSGITESDDHILGSDNVTFSLGRQNWVLPDGLHEMSFSGLTFNGKGQRFELDSFAFHRNMTAGHGEMLVKANKFFFNSRHLPAIYMRNELLIDSLVCVDPEIILPSSGNEKYKKPDSLSVRNYIFKLINIKYIDVQNGSVVLKNKNGQGENAATHKSNLNIYNLTLNPEQQQPLSTDSINADLSKLKLLSKDSLFQLEIDEFSFRNNTVIFRNVDFGPTAYKGADRGIHFSAPALLVRNISLEDLLRKRITASDAELLRPVINFVSRSKKRKPAVAASITPGNKMDMFYKSLHGLSELINVEHFKLFDGVAVFSINGKQPLNLSLSKLNAHILLNKLFVSDSLVDIKHAMPDVRFGKADITTPEMHLNLDSYRFDGTLRHNWGDGLTVALSNGTRLKGRKIYWEVFDWDVFQSTGDIQIDLLNIGELQVLTIAKNRIADASKKEPKDLPVIRIGKLKAGKIDFSTSGPAAIHFLAKNFYADSVKSLNHYFTWINAFAGIYDIRLKSNNATASIKELDFNSQKESILKGILFESENAKGRTSIKVPSIIVETRLHSTDFSHFKVPSLTLNNPEINITSNKEVTKKAKQKTAGGTTDFALGNITIRQGRFTYTSLSKKDTLSATGIADLNAHDLKMKGGKNAQIGYDALNMKLTDIHLNNHNLSLQLPDASLDLKNGKMVSMHGTSMNITTAFEFAWQKASVNYSKDSTELRLKNLSGSFSDKSLSIGKGQKPVWQNLADKTSIKEGNILYRDKKITGSVNDYSWDPYIHQMALSQFSVIPVKSREEVFSTAPWQGDYMIIKGDKLSLSGIHFSNTPHDSLIRVRNIIAGNIDLNTSRDKHMPFQHGIEKPMPTKLIERIPLPFKVDTVTIQHSDVTYNEHSVATGKWSSVPLKDINGYLLNITNRPGTRDSLEVVATTRLLDNHIRHFSYIESYKDPLSYFRAKSNLAPTQLTRFSEVSMPMAAVSITKGTADTMYAHWEGNKYAAYGNMNFFYRDLKIKVHNKDEKKKGGIKESLETFLANLILPNGKKRPSVIFVERDTEKFIFNYWVKAHTRGLLSTVGIKGNNKYRKAYLRKQQKYSLPLKTMKELKQK